MDRAELAGLLGVAGVVAKGACGSIVVEEPAPQRFMAAFASAVAAGGPVFLADPTWGPAERGEMTTALSQSPINDRRSEKSRGWLMVPSGGTGGRLKFARHDEDTISAAVRGFCAHFGLTQVNAVGVLPLHHVSGLMAWMRCALTGGEYVSWDWKQLEAGDTPAPREGTWVLSLVPTQLQRLLESRAAIAWLRRFHVIFLGGGPVWPELTDAAAGAGLRLSLSYGMTETAAMIAALRPEEVLAGGRSSGSVMPHARVRIDESEQVVSITGDSVFRGYWPEWNDAREVATEDLGRIDERGHLHILGRRDAMIISGGKKVQPADVEAALRASGEFSDVAVIGVPDREWGEVVVACYPAADGRTPDIGRAAASLAAFQRPKRFVAITPWPRTAQGKVNRVALLKALSTQRSAFSGQQ